MSDKKINFSRIFLTGIIWTVLYGAVTDILSCAILDFSPLSLSDWAKRIGDFLNEIWFIRTGKDWSLLLLMILFIPVYFIGWRKFYRFHWNRLVPHRFHKKEKYTQHSAGDPTKRGFGPQKLRVQTSALLSVRAVDTQTPIPMANDQANIPPLPSEQPVPTTSQYEDAAEVQDMLAQTAHISADFFPHVLLDGHYASFAMSTEKLAAVVRIINRPESTFAVDTDVDVSSSDWFYESGLIPAPAKDIIAIAQNLQANEPESVATPVILLMGGTLLNVDETMAYFEKHNIILTRTENVEIDEIPLIMDFMNDYFGSRSESEAL
ncbi:MAG: hypothetical protein SPL08_04240 [Pseudomonadota bacterium]|nr:hypothetical protein [Pseudomonadota bacterium]